MIKKIAPDKTVIGLGSCAPTNFHALNAGVSKNLDGVVEHPYTFSLPPEKVPFGKRLAKRDGIAIGDDEHTFRGLVESYHEHFSSVYVPRASLPACASVFRYAPIFPSLMEYMPLSAICI